MSRDAMQAQSNIATPPENPSAPFSVGQAKATTAPESKTPVATTIAPERDHDWAPWLKFTSDSLSATAWPIVLFAGLFMFRKELRFAITKLSSLKAAGVEAAFAQVVDQMVPLSAPEPVQHAHQPDATVVDTAEHMPMAGEPVSASPCAEHTVHGPDDSSSPSAPEETIAKEPTHVVPQVNSEATIRRMLELFYRWGHAAELTSVAQRKRILELAGPHTVLRLKDAADLAKTNRGAAVVAAWATAERALRIILSQVPRQRASIARKMRMLFEDGVISASVLNRFTSLRRLSRSASGDNSFVGTEADVLQYIDRIKDLLIAVGNAVQRNNELTQQEPNPPGAP